MIDELQTQLRTDMYDADDDQWTAMCTLQPCGERPESTASKGRLTRLFRSLLALCRCSPSCLRASAARSAFLTINRLRARKRRNAQE